MDFPGATLLKPVISTYSRESMGSIITSRHTSSVPVSAVQAANRANSFPLALPVPYLVKQVWWANGTAVAGNVQVGVYTLGGALLLAGANTAQAGTSVVQSVALGTPVLLLPGSYYMSISCSSGSATLIRINFGSVALMQMAGAVSQASANPLPDPATFATVAGVIIPLFGIANAGVI